MYGNDYSVSLLGVAAWLVVAALGGGGIGCVRQSPLRGRLAVCWALLPAIAITSFCTILYVVLPADRFLSPVGWHWLMMLFTAAVLSLVLTLPWAFVVWLSVKAARRFDADQAVT